MGRSLSKCKKKPNGGGRSRVSNVPVAELSQEGHEGGAVYTTVDEPNFLRPYRDPESVKDNVDFPLDGRLLDPVSDEELVALFHTAPRLHKFSATKIVRISKSLVLKGGPDVAASEARNMVFAAESLRLPVPKVHRSFTASVLQSYSDETEDGHFIVMDYIAGPTVEESWHSLEQDAREAATRQVADMIETMQSHRLNDLPPGPIGSPTEKCQGPWFTDYGAGPFATVQELKTAIVLLWRWSCRSSRIGTTSWHGGRRP
ncbi:hypothetical protein GE09DRAFT_1147837 [Coniochaeta sp. 2T2.1]|nr:hypothetical protein GE09DRAFT_1147837 [Coniochaeta sp. 2T2.1]